MSSIGKTKGLKKLVSLLVVICMVVALIPASLTFANTSDVITVANQLNQLTPTQKSTILFGLLDYATAHAADGEALTAEAAVAEVLQYPEVSAVVVNSGIPGDGKISNGALLLLANKVLQYRDILVALNSGLGINSSTLKAKLQVSSELELYTVIYNNTKPLIKLNANNQFEALADAQTLFDQELTALKFSETEKILLKTVMFTPRVDANKNPIPSYFDTALTKLNAKIATYNFSASDIATLLRAYKICEAAAVTPTPTPSTGNGGGGGGGIIIVPTPTPTPTPSATPTPTSPSDVAKAVDGAISDLGNAVQEIATLSTEKAVEKAVSVITAVQSLPLRSVTLAQEKTIEANVIALVQAVMNKVAEQTVASTVTGNSASATISDAAVSDLSAKMDTIVATADKLSAQIKDTKLDVQIQKVLEINVTSDKNVNSSSLNIPAQIFSAAADKKIDSIVMKTEVATIAINPQALGNVKEPVKLSANKVDTEQLPEAYKAAVGNSPVMDFTLTVGDKAVTNFSKPVRVSLPYTLKTGENPRKITVFFLSPDGRLENVAGTYDAATGTVSFSTRHFSLYVVKTSDVSFADVKSDDWFKDTVETMASKGIIKGYADGSYLPQNKITRAEFASLLVRSFNLADATAVNSFSDVKSDDWFAADVAAAAKSGIVSGVGNGAFAPTENISRQDMAVMMARALQIVKSKSGEVISDTKTLFKDAGSIDSYAQSGVAVAAKYEIIKGLPDGNFAPGSDATRAEAATMISRLFFLK